MMKKLDAWVVSLVVPSTEERRYAEPPVARRSATALDQTEKQVDPAADNASQSGTQTRRPSAVSVP
jgi:hypothetical protein